MELSPHFLKDLSYALLLLSQIMIDTVHYSAKSTVSWLVYIWKYWHNTTTWHIDHPEFRSPEEETPMLAI